MPLLLCSAWSLTGQNADLGEAPRPRADFAGQSSVTELSATESVVPWLLTSSRAAVRASYLNTFVPSRLVAMGWSGNLADANAGSTSPAYQNAVTTRINWLRSFAGIASNVALNTTYNTGDQQAAMMMSVNGELSHSPPSNWLDYSSAGATAAGNSNLCLGFPTNDPGCLEMYMQDFGANNTEAGHRRWILYPQTTSMGTGDVAFNLNYLSANALWVIDYPSYSNPRPTTRDPFISWPPNGYVPYQLVYPRWSFSYAGADFTAATVTMSSDGTSIPVSLEPQAQGYGENTIVWIWNNLDATGPISPVAPAHDTTVTVNVDNVMISGSPQSFTYHVTIFNPSQPTHVIGDFDGNGVPDLVWQNSSTHQIAVHYYGGPGGATYENWNWLDSTGISGWHLAAVADFNGDGVPDLVWENDTTHQVTVHYYGGAGGAVEQGWNWLNATGVSGWHVAAAADFNGDGVPDLVWENDTTHQVTVNYYGGAGGAVLQGWNWLEPIGASGWHVAAAADFDGNGVPDLVWQCDTTRQVTVHYFGGTGGAVLQGWNWLYANNVPGWHVGAALDFNGDGVPDLVWQDDTTGQVTIHYYGGNLGAVDQSWNWLDALGAAGWSVVN